MKNLNPALSLGDLCRIFPLIMALCYYTGHELDLEGRWVGGGVVFKNRPPTRAEKFILACIFELLEWWIKYMITCRSAREKV